MVTIENVEFDTEGDIIIGVVISKTFATQIFPILKTEWLESDYAKVVYDWCKNYFKSYGNVPGKDVKEIFRTKLLQEDETKAALVGKFLSNISNKYAEASAFNAELRIDQAIKYIEERSVLVRVDNCQRYIEMGRFDKAAEEMRTYRDVEKLTTGWINPFDKKFIRSVLLDEDEDEILVFPGALGKLVGPECRGYLTAVLGKMKGGKSFWLQEMVIHAILNKKKCLYFDFEMNEKRMEKRLLKRFLAYGRSDGFFDYPVFDCLKNQDGTCKSAMRTNKLKLLDSSGNRPEYRQDMRYRPCTICRGKSDFVPCVWYKTLRRNLPSVAQITKKMEALEKVYGNFLKIKSFPAGTVNTDRMRAEMDRLRYTDNFEPDFLAVDYPKLMKPEYPGLKTATERIDASWIALKGMTGEYKIGIAAGHQTTRKALKKKHTQQDDISGFIDVLAHVDKMCAINQTWEEKDMGMMRISMLGHRDDDFNEERDVMVLQQRETGQTLLDSEFVPKKNNYQEEEEREE